MDSSPKDPRELASTKADSVEGAILFLRGQRVILDAQLALLYGVPTKVLSQAVKRNRERFPADFMFQMTPEETRNLKSQFVTSSWGGSRKPSYVFTEQGVAMLSSVLHSRRAVQVNIEIMRAFVRLRRLMTENGELARKLREMEKKYDGQFQIVFEAIRQLMEPPEEENKKEPIGFR